MENENQNFDIIGALVEEEEVKKIDLSELGFISPDVLNLIPVEIAVKYKLIPFERVEDSLKVAMANPFDILAEEAIRSKTKFEPEIYYTPEAQIDEWLSRLSLKNTGFLEGVDDPSQVDIIENEDSQTEDISIELLKDEADAAPAIRYVNSILLQAIQERASDIHIEPQETELRIRFRIDGALRDIATPPKRLQSGIISRIKILGALDIAERRIPLDGRSKLNVFGRAVDFRISTLPAIYGEKVVLRILDQDNRSLEVRDLGLEENATKRFKETLVEPHGLILVTGPTGSGKTTTLYSALNYVNVPVKNTVTIEDPVEYRLPGITQTPAKPHLGLTFAVGLRAILRQDPDVIMVGEIRDLETAEISISAALTGHLVLSTLHTNNSIATIMRLIDMGIDKHLIASSTLLIVAQRLVRRTCFHCAENYELSKAEREQLGSLIEDMDKPIFSQGKGCSKCGGTGYWGRLAIFEFFYLDNQMRNMIIAGKNAEEITEVALELGMETLFMDGLRKAKAGITTLDEVKRVNSDSY